MTRVLPDVNVLLALIDSDHVNHDVSHRWFEEQSRDGWATCAITENGFVRVMSQPSYPSPRPPAAAASLLRQARSANDHDFWPCDVSILDTVDLGRVHGPAQLTDAHLLALAVARDGRLVTLDRRITVTAARGARPEHLVTL